MMLDSLNKNYPDSGGFLKQSLYSTLMGFTFSRHNFLYALTDGVIQDFQTSGILEHSFKMYDFKGDLKNEIYVTLHKKAKELKQLKFDDLSYGFTMWMIAGFVSIVVFLMEIALNNLKLNLFGCLKEFIGIIIILRFVKNQLL